MENNNKVPQVVKEKKVIFNFLDGKKEVSVGDTIAVASHRTRKGDEPRTQTIEKIGNKFITTGRDKFYIETGYSQQEYGLPDGAYSSIEAYKECVHKNIFIDEVQQEIRNRKLTYDESVAIKSILNQKKDRV